jgi:hypothetical protein
MLTSTSKDESMLHFIFCQNPTKDPTHLHAHVLISVTWTLCSNQELSNRETSGGLMARPES